MKTTNLIIIVIFGISVNGYAQKYTDLKVQKEPLVLESVGRFYVEIGD